MGEEPAAGVLAALLPVSGPPPWISNALAVSMMASVVVTPSMTITRVQSASEPLIAHFSSALYWLLGSLSMTSAAEGPAMSVARRYWHTSMIEHPSKTGETVPGASNPKSSNVPLVTPGAMSHVVSPSAPTPMTLAVTGCGSNPGM